jgi:sulfite exporter TauE/SafE
MTKTRGIVKLEILYVMTPFIVGLVGSLHCLGMCGPLVFAYSLHQISGRRIYTKSVSLPV